LAAVIVVRPLFFAAIARVGPTSSLMIQAVQTRLASSPTVVASMKFFFLPLSPTVSSLLLLVLTPPLF
jgi:hypothetical protein